MVFRMNYTKLTNNLIDLVKEEQAKLGYRKEAIRLYYPLSSLQHILGTTDSAEQLTEKLQKEADFAKDSLGTLDISCQNDRFCIGIPAVGSEWVHDHISRGSCRSSWLYNGRYLCIISCTGSTC